MKKPRNYEDEDDNSQLIGVGSYQSCPKTGMAKTAQIGFVRKKAQKKRVTPEGRKQK